MYPLKFEPILKQTLWGGDKIIPFKHLNSDLKGVGESWEISGVENNESVVANGPDKGLTLADMVRKYREELVGEANYARFGNKFPLLIKFIDAKQDLSIQVHPTDELAKKRHNSMGKTEMWYVVDADKGAKLRSGFSEQITPKEYKERVLNNTITDVLQEYEIHPGDVFFLPAGRVHSIGAGSFIAELLPWHGPLVSGSAIASILLISALVQFSAKNLAAHQSLRWGLMTLLLSFMLLSLCMTMQLSFFFFKQKTAYEIQV